ncbi:1889_t:CDS:2, partial [Paraglomus occultum]
LGSEYKYYKYLLTKSGHIGYKRAKKTTQAMSKAANKLGEAFWHTTIFHSSQGIFLRLTMTTLSPPTVGFGNILSGYRRPVTYNRALR